MYMCTCMYMLVTSVNVHTCTCALYMYMYMWVGACTCTMYIYVYGHGCFCLSGRSSLHQSLWLHLHKSQCIIIVSGCLHISNHFKVFKLRPLHAKIKRRHLLQSLYIGAYIHVHICIIFYALFLQNGIAQWPSVLKLTAVFQ